MSRITLSSVDSYIKDLMPARDAVLSEMEALALRDRIPIVGPVVGSFLFQAATLTGATRIFELGSAIGYSTIWLARALRPGGKIYYTDGDKRNAALADDFLKRAGVRDRVEMLVGDALTSFAHRRTARTRVPRCSAPFHASANGRSRETRMMVDPLAVAVAWSPLLSADGS